MISVNVSIPDEVDKSLSSGRFGDDRSLAHNMRTLYTGIHKIVDASINSNITTEMSSSSAAVQVVTRATLDEAFVMLTTNPEEAKEKVTDLKQFFAALADCQSEPNALIFPEQDLQPLSNWKSCDFHQAIVDRMRDSMAKDGFTSIEVVEPSESHRKAIDEAKALLNQLTPRCASSTLPLVRCLALIDAEFESAYVNETPFMYMVRVDMLADPLQAADTILHEALHQKMADIRLTRQLLLEGYDDLASEASADVPLPWGASSPRPFSVARGLATYHVYVHSTLLHAAALAHLPHNTLLQSIGGEEIVRRLTVAFERAAYLYTNLRSDVAQQKTGSDASRFMAWIGDALNRLREVRLLDGTKLGDWQPSFSNNVV